MNQPSPHLKLGVLHTSRPSRRKVVTATGCTSWAGYSTREKLSARPACLRHQPSQMDVHMHGIGDATSLCSTGCIGCKVFVAKAFHMHATQGCLQPFSASGIVAKRDATACRLQGSRAHGVPQCIRTPPTATKTSCNRLSTA